VRGTAGRADHRRGGRRTLSLLPRCLASLGFSDSVTRLFEGPVGQGPGLLRWAAVNPVFVFAGGSGLWMALCVLGVLGRLKFVIVWCVRFGVCKRGCVSLGCAGGVTQGQSDVGACRG
jgi:hypothetical protein